ncbi:sulfotransferase family protein [Limnovirga soli]|uniref:Sulfotransferase n=1 Tax=Limnovirga soli TaxID=2656915 RepID=A0A8J8FJF8_9BACT|nr:hypothetical protein [Limnovirga soli]NNV57449.1 hypothetical protein [Limnovirga soli]
MTKFIIFTTPRTGSTLLIKSLDTHPEILCAGEVFFFKGDIYHTEYKYKFWRLPVIGNKLNYVINYPKIYLTLSGFLNKFFASRNDGITARGFKLMHFQTYYTPGIFSYLKKNDVKVIVLIRKNSLRNTLSDLRARSTKVYHNESGVKTDAIPKFKIDLNELGNKMQQIEGFNKQLENASAGLNRKIVYYEDFENWDNTIADLQDYLNVTQMKIEPVSKKLNPGKLEDMVENYKEMKDWLLARGYEKYLD